MGERRYFNLDLRDEPRETKFVEFTKKNPWGVNLRPGKYLYVILPRTLLHPERLRVASISQEMVVSSAFSHIDIATTKSFTGQPYTSAVLAAGMVHVSDERLQMDYQERYLISEVDQNSGHFKPGNNNPEWKEQVRHTTRRVFTACQAPINESTRFTTFRDRGN